MKVRWRTMLLTADGELILDRRCNLDQAVVRVRIRPKTQLVTPERYVSRFRELCAEATGE